MRKCTSSVQLCTWHVTGTKVLVSLLYLHMAEALVNEK